MNTDYDQKEPGIYDAEKATNIGCGAVLVGIILVILILIFAL